MEPVSPAETESKLRMLLESCGFDLKKRLLAEIIDLDLFGKEIGDDDLPLFAPLTGLEFLSLARTRVSDRGVVHLRALPRLGELHLDYDDITNDCLELIALLPALTTLDLTATDVTDNGLLRLQPLADRLRRFYMMKSRLTDTGIRNIGFMSALETLILYENDLTDESVRHFSRFKNLRLLDVTDTKITTRGLRGLRAALPQCRVIS